jgi:uncharacterized protein YegL
MAQVLPFYLVCDTSASMDGEPIATLNAAVNEVRVEIGDLPAVAAKTRLCVIAFNSLARVLLPLSQLSEVAEIDPLTARGGTKYAAAFDLLYRTITADLARLRAAGDLVYRPAVFFLTDGQPLDDWAESHARLTDPAWPDHPDIVPFGFGDLDDPDTVQRLATGVGFLADGTMKPEEAVRELAKMLIGSIINSGNRLTPEGGLGLVAPTKVAGFTSTLPADLL